MGKRAYGANSVDLVPEEPKTKTVDNQDDADFINELFEEETESEDSSDIETTDSVEFSENDNPEDTVKKKRRRELHAKVGLICAIVLVLVGIAAVIGLGLRKKVSASNSTDMGVITAFCNSVNTHSKEDFLKCYHDSYLTSADHGQKVNEFADSLFTTDSLTLDTSSIKTVAEGDVTPDEFKTTYGDDVDSAKVLLLSIEGYQAEDMIVYRFRENMRFTVADIDGSYYLYNVEPDVESFEFIEDDAE